MGKSGGGPTHFRDAVAAADRQSIAPTKAWAVAARAGLRRGDRDAGIEIQLFAERRFFGCVRVFFWEWDQRWAPVLCLHRANGCSGFRGGVGRRPLSPPRAPRPRNLT